ncbi:hypothetical protein L7F22_037600 [Adiantum nelumboides]|nr:hypothetical protein [Adiantum nelumboides]
MAYQLKFPNHWLIHNSFHVSLLKPYKGEPPREDITEDPPEVEDQEEVLQPESILRHEDKVLRHGVWKYEKSEGHDNWGLLASEKARKYGIATRFPEVVEFKEKPIVLQYDLRLQNGIECGGSYLKFLQVQKDGWTPSQLNNKAPYSIMFGPDKCGSTNKVHFIFQHKHPKTGAFVEHHLKFPPSPINDKLSHVYTAVLYPNNTVSILIDGQEKQSADLLSDNFDPLCFRLE